MFDSWLTLSGIGMDLKTVSRNMDPDTSGSAGAWGKPLRFATHQDPAGRFEFGYPSGWDLEPGDGVLASSKRLGSYAKVDVFPRGNRSGSGSGKRSQRQAASSRS